MTALEAAVDPKATLNSFTLEDLAQFTREGSFPAGDSPDFRVLYVGRDDVLGALEYTLARCSRSLRFNQFGYDSDSLDRIIRHLIESEHVYVQGTLDKSQSGGVHERKIIAGWSAQVRNSFAIGQSATHQISHTKGGVLDGLVAWEGSTNWSGSGMGEGIGLHGAANQPAYKAQNNTCAFYVHPVEIAKFTAELDEEHVTCLRQEEAARAR